ncbi:hypothetical protein ACS15_0008 [Ralstonia insidiosa]|uniref:Uncharacterized protein n=1 Tax=Ralstonia insidiosa TaxID=190721 RepID=A0AAC9BE07_9RALS|nr:hypothetical protein ACS15_0008 [Ralstonia insidiosa]
MLAVKHLETRLLVRGHSRTAASLLEHRGAIWRGNLQLGLEQQFVVLRTAGRRRLGIDEEQTDHPVAIELPGPTTNHHIGLSGVGRLCRNVSLGQVNHDRLAAHRVALPDRLGVALFGCRLRAFLSRVSPPSGRDHQLSGASVDSAGQPDCSRRQGINRQRQIIGVAVLDSPSTV